MAVQIDRSSSLGENPEPDPGRSGRRRPWRRRFVRVAAVGDALVGAFALTLVLWLREHPAALGHLLVPVVFALVWVGWLAAGRAYEWSLFGEGVEEYRRVVVAGFFAVGIAGVVATIASLEYGRPLVLALLLASIGTVAWRRIIRGVLHRRRISGRGMNRALLVGPTDAVEVAARQSSRSRYHGLLVVGALVPPGSRPPNPGLLPEVAYGSDVVETAAALDVDDVVLLRPVDLASVELRDLMWSLADSGRELLIAPMSMPVSQPRLTVRPVDGLPLLQIAAPQINGLARTMKSVFDRCSAAVGLFLLAPVLLFIAARIKLDDGGPVFYRQERVGKDDERFHMLKFRTMVVDADRRIDEVQHLNTHTDGVHLAIANDPRVTRAGSFLRRYSLDELPQLINVLRGDMSLVGPRPPLPKEVEHYPDHGWIRMAVRPGLTGLWQIKGPARHHLSLDEAIELDVRYVENWSFSYDMAILWKTVGVVVKGSGVASPPAVTDAKLVADLPMPRVALEERRILPAEG
jgi:exopolysaccharide biosynthesis polyprenyl glycosylphosphotransferase